MVLNQWDECKERNQSFEDKILKTLERGEKRGQREYKKKIDIS